MKLLIVSSKQNMLGYIDLTQALDSFGVEVTCVQYLKYCSLFESRPLYIIPFPRLLGLVKRFDPDFIMTDSTLHAIDLAKMVNRRVLFHLRGAWTEFYWNRAMEPSFFVRMYTHYVATRSISCIKKADLILPNSRWLQEQVRHDLPNLPTQVLYVGINAERWVPSHNTALNVRHPAVVSVFPLNIYPKVLGLLKFIRVIKKMPDVNFYFVGNGSYFNLVKQGCPPNMFLMGRVSRLGVKKLLESGDIFVHPSGLDASPRSVKEASLMEKPIIASNVGGTPEIVKDGQTGYLCNIDDVDEWIGRMRFLLDNSDVARRLGKKAREFVIETFSWRKIAESLLRTLKAFGE